MNDTNSKIVSLRRRTFLSALGISGAVSVAGCERQPVEKSLPLLRGNADGNPGESVSYASTCLECPAACGVLVTVRDGRPIKLEGLPEHPMSQGGLCTLAQASVRGLYDAGRLRKPLVDGAQADWQALDSRVTAALKAAQGKVAVLTPPLVGVASRRAVVDLVDKYDGRLVQYEPGLTTGAGMAEAYRLLDGRVAYPDVDLGATDLWLTLGGDPIGTSRDAVMLTRQLADRRRARKDGADFRHMHVEGSFSLTGAGADVRVQATSRERALFAAHLLSRIAAKESGTVADLAKRLTKSVPALTTHEHKIATIAAELRRHAGKVLVSSASRQPAEQLVVALLNRLLGAETAALRLDARPRRLQGSDDAMAELLTAIDKGDVKALIIIDLNPVEQLPDGNAFAVMLKKLSLSVTITSRPTATAGACAIVAASHHELERWSDAAPRKDALTIAQPTLRPLFETRDPIESLQRWVGKETTAYDYVSGYWKGRADVGVEGWDKMLSDGLASSAIAALAAIDAAAAENPAAEEPAEFAVLEAHIKTLSQSDAKAGEQLEVELLEEVGPRDGSHSFNPWLRELPDPMTRNSWTATVRLAPSLAKSKGIADGDMLSVTVGKRVVQMQARIMPGQHPRVLGVPIGYGVKDGDAGEEIRNGYRLATFEGTGANGRWLRTGGLAASLQRDGEGPPLPLMQWESRTHDRPILFQVETDHEKIPEPHHVDASLWGDDFEYSPHWQMVIDLDSCTGCSSCVIACQAENNIPVVGPDNMANHRDMFWLRLDRYYMGDEDDPEVLFEPMLCAQCDNAPCETVCPVAATVHSHDGLNMQAYNRCVGTRYCANNCPYKVRRFNWFDFTPGDPLERLVLNPDVVVRERGVMEKCTFCVQRIQKKRIEDKRPGGSSEPVQTACQQSCPAKAISFGDGKSDKSIQEQQHEPRAFQVLKDLGVRPSITYLARVRRRLDGEGKGKPSDPHHEEGGT